MTLKRQMRIVGIDEGSFEEKQAGEQVLTVGVVFRGADHIDGVLSTSVAVDGLDATEKIARMINASRQKFQLRAIMLDGVALGGFNLVDIQKLNEQTGLPVIVVIRRMPDLEGIYRALKNFSDEKQRRRILKKAGQIHELEINNPFLRKPNTLYYQLAGIEKEQAEALLELTTVRGVLPEPVRVAHLIAGGITRGESRGRA